ncbi:Cytochrome c7 c [uncultured archaeon]|nr:Cytochrome c7 c [uncultured archaeon]
MPTKWIMLRQKLARLAIYKNLVIVLLMIVVFDTSYFSGYLGRNSENIKNDSITEDISSIVNYTSANETLLNDTSFKQSCSNCHNSNTTYSGVNREWCARCHASDHALPSGEPSRYNDQGTNTIHKEHTGKMGTRGCESCHGVLACKSCHGGHSGIIDINTSRNCQNCHGGLLQPNGHNEERDTFKKGSHNWMIRCDTCHAGTNLKFKELAMYDGTASSQMCGNCHSKEYKDPSHYVIQNGIEKQKCIDCHNPHSPAGTNFSFDIIPSAQNEIDNISQFLKDRTIFVGLFLLMMISSVFEYAFKPKKGHVILAKHLKIEHDKSKARTIKISLSQPFDSAILNTVNDIINKNNAKSVGISAGNDEAIIFISRDKKDKDRNIIKEIRSIPGISKAEYSKEFEIR